MVDPEPVLRIFVLGEDSSKHAFDTLVQILRKTCKLIEPRVGTHRISFEPGDERVRGAMRGTQWKTRQQRVFLVRSIATKVAEDGPPLFVVFHVDGDVPWASRRLSENVRKAQDLLSRVVRVLEEKRLPREAKRLAANCIVCSPFYSIEAWLFQNTRTASELCRRGCGKHLALLTTWESNRGSLDEIVKPKDALCLGASHNKVLATSASVADILAADKSYADFVRAARSCMAFRRALRATYAVSADNGINH